jgi:hypothetical protein
MKKVSNAKLCKKQRIKKPKRLASILEEERLRVSKTRMISISKISSRENKIRIEDYKRLEVNAEVLKQDELAKI